MADKMPDLAESFRHPTATTKADLDWKAGFSPRTLTRPGVVLILTALSVVVALGRLHTFHEPLERDLATYAVVARELLDGQKLYSEVWDNRTPVIYLTYAAAQLLVGDGPGHIYLLGVTAALATLVGVYWSASPGGRRRELGLCAAVFWAAVQSGLWLQSNQPNTEVFMNACLIWAFALLVSRESHPLGWRRALGIGGLLALGTLYKHILIVQAAFFALAHVWLPPDGRAGRGRALREALVMAVPGLVAWGGLFAYFGVTERLDDFYQAVFVFNRHDIAETLGGGFLELDTYVQTMSAFLLVCPLALLGALGLFGGVRRRWQRPGFLLFAYALATFLSTALPHRSYAHYYQLWLPVLCVAGAWVLDALLTPMCFPRRLPVGVGIVLFLLLCLRVPEYWLTPENYSRKKYGTAVFVQARDAARDIDALLGPDETFYQWGFEPELYWYTGRRPASGVLWAWSALYTPLAVTQTERILADLQRAKPELVVVVTEDTPAPEWHQVLQWIAAHYEPMGGYETKYPFRFLYRRGGRLETRLHGRP